MQSYIKTFRVFGIFALLAVLVDVAPRSHAQFLNFSARVSHTNTLVNSPILYSIDVTNISGITQQIFITNRFSSPVGLTSTGLFFLNTTLSVSSTQIVAWVQTITPAQFELLDLQVIATNATRLTNFVTIAMPNANTNFGPFTLVTTFTNPPVFEGDIQVTVRPPSAPVLAGDDFTYVVAVTNASPTPLSNVALTNTLPSGVAFRNTSPTNRAVINVGNLAANAGRRFNLQVRATSAGTKTLAASAGFSGASDTNTINNVATNILVVEPLLTGQLIATNLTETAVLNPQNGLMEQTIRLVNIGSSNVSSARVIVTDPGFWLRNAVGTNNGDPFVAYTAPLAPGQGVDLVLQYFNPRREEFSVPDENYSAVPTSAYNVATPGSFTLEITSKVLLPDGSVLIEFPAVPGRSYTILYSSTANFAEVFAAIPSIVAPANKVQWIDDGPPKTISRPADASSRFYRVLQNP